MRLVQGIAWRGTLLTVIACGLCLPVRSQGVPPGFVDEVVVAQLEQTTGLTFDHHGRMYIWQKKGLISYFDEGMSAPEVLLDITEEVGNWSDHGLNSFALDPNFDGNGFVYLCYTVDLHHLMEFGTPAYDPDASLLETDTQGRITRYRIQDPHAVVPSVVSNSRKVLLGETIGSGLPICASSHGLGSIVFGEDGSLLASSGDSNLGGSGTGTCLSDGIIELKADVQSYRSQLLSSHSGKILRLNPFTGAGVSSNPFFDASDPFSASSRVWVLGLRQPYRFSVKPGTGSSDPLDGNPGALYIGDVGDQSWEELNVATSGGQNFGWPVYEGMDLMPWWTLPQNAFDNLDAANPLFGQSIPGQGLCEQAYFDFKDLLINDSLQQAFWPNPCDPSQPIPASLPTFVHTRPVLAWAHDTGPALTGIYDSMGQPASILVGAEGSPVSGAQFSGSTSIGGAWYDGRSFPPEFQDGYFTLDYAERWIKFLRFDDNHKPVSVQPFATDPGPVSHLATHPFDGSIYYIKYKAGPGVSDIHRVSYGGNAYPNAVPTATPHYGPEPLLVRFSALASNDSDGFVAGYLWDFGDGSATTPLNSWSNPTHWYPSADITDLGEIIAKLDEMDPPHPMGAGVWNKEVIRDGYFPPSTELDVFAQFHTAHVDDMGLPDKGLEDWIGYEFEERKSFLGLIFQEGMNQAPQGGWLEGLEIHVRRQDTGEWNSVTGLEISPLPLGDLAVNFESFQINFDPKAGDAIRVFGVPGGSGQYFTVGELRVIALPEGGNHPPTAYPAKLTVTDDIGAASSREILVSINNSPPIASMASPPNGMSYSDSSPTVIPLMSDSLDLEHLESELSCTWITTLVHDIHVHEGPPDQACPTSATLNPHGEQDGDILYYEVYLSVFDPLGLSSSVTSYLIPDGDCNLNGIFDSTDLLSGFSLDLDFNGTPDECEQDCNSNGLNDAAEGHVDPLGDLDGNGIPDSCEDCNLNGIPDYQDLLNGTASDCNNNQLPDDCDLLSGYSVDLTGGIAVINGKAIATGDGIPDECAYKQALREQ